MHTIKPLDEEAVNKAVLETGGIITVEENNIIGGLGGAISEHCLSSGNLPRFFSRVGLNDEYSSVVGDQSFLRDYYAMNAKHIVDRVKKYVK